MLTERNTLVPIVLNRLGEDHRLWRCRAMAADEAKYCRSPRGEPRGVAFPRSVAETHLGHLACRGGAQVFLESRENIIRRASL